MQTAWDRCLCPDVPLLAAVSRGLALLSCIALGWSSELPIYDLRLGVDLFANDFEYTASNATGRVSGEDHFDFGLGTSIRAHYRFGADDAKAAWLLGAELHGGMQTYDDDDYLRTGLRGIAGYTHGFGAHWSIIALARAGYGWGRYSFAGNDFFATDSADGPVTDYGLVLGVRRAITNDIGIQAEIAYLVAKGRLEGSHFDLDIDEAGFSAFIGFTYRFGDEQPLILPGDAL